MICMPHAKSNISITAKLGVINSQFYRFLRLCSCKEFFVSQMVSLTVLLKNKGYPLKILLKRTRGLLNKENFFLELQYLEYSKWFCISLVSGELLVSPLGLYSSLLSFSVCFVDPVVLFLFFVISLCCLLLSSSMAESSLCFLNCSRNLVHKLAFSLAFTHCREWWSQWESCDREVTIIHATVDDPWTGVRLALLFILLLCFISFFVSWFFVLCFVFPSLEFSVAGWRSVNLALP